MPTSFEDYGRWASAYALRFGFEQRHAAMLANWFDILGIYEPADLDAAAGLLARRDYPSYPSDHLKALLGCLREVVAARQVAEADAGRRAAEPDQGTCTLCGGTGRVIVPHPRAVRGGRWVPLKIARGGANWYTAAVLCRCSLGRWYGRSGERTPLTLDAYERLCPRWRDEIRHRAAEDAAVAAERSQPVDHLHRLARDGLDAALSRLQRGLAGEDF